MESARDSVENPDVRFGAALLLGWVGGFLPIESGPIWIPAAIAHYHQSAVTVGGIASLQMLASAVAAMMFAPLLGHRNPRHALIFGVAIVTIAAICSLPPLPFAPFAALRIAEGLGSGICIAVGGMLASRTASPTRTFGILLLGQIAGTVVVFSGAAPLISRFGLGSVYAVVLALGLSALAALFTRADWPIRARADGRKSERPVGRSELLLACLGITMVFCAFVAVVTSAGAIGFYAGLGLGDVGIALAISTLAGALGSGTTVVLSSRIDRRWLLGASICGVLGSGFLLTFVAHGLASLTLSLGGLVFSINMAVPIMFALVSSIQARGGTAAAAAQAAQMMGAMLGPIAGASVIVHSVPAVGLVAGVIAAAGMALSALRLARNPLPPVLARQGSEA